MSKVQRLFPDTTDVVADELRRVALTAAAHVDEDAAAALRVFARASLHLRDGDPNRAVRILLEDLALLERAVREHAIVDTLWTAMRHAIEGREECAKECYQAVLATV